MVTLIQLRQKPEDSKIRNTFGPTHLIRSTPGLEEKCLNRTGSFLTTTGGQAALLFILIRELMILFLETVGLMLHVCLYQNTPVSKNGSEKEFI